MSSTTLQEEVWSLKIKLDDAKDTIQIKSAQAEAQAGELRRLRWENHTKDIQLNETRRVLAETLKGPKVDIDNVKIQARSSGANSSEQASAHDHHGTASPSVREPPSLDSSSLADYFAGTESTAFTLCYLSQTSNTFVSNHSQHPIGLSSHHHPFLLFRSHACPSRATS